jgi:protein-S-isoprenylcysteine O-methyltransferase Ste14
MPHDLPSNAGPAAAARVRPARRVFALPSREGLLICAASLMPAYLFGLIGLLSAYGLAGMLQAGPSDDPRGAATGWLHLGHQTVGTAFSLLLCWLFLIRRPSTHSRGIGGRLSDVIAVSAMAMSTLAVIVVAQTSRLGDRAPLVTATAEVLTTIGLVVMVVGLASLGRSFGIMPRARGLVQTGLYRWVRHPVYLGELLVLTGLLLLVAHPLTVSVYAVFVALQVYRLIVEERTLALVYPEYAEYRARTARLLPGVY